MKLNYKRVICVGFAFFLITAFWQAYDKTIPLILTYRFKMNQTLSGLIMALDNILAVFLLPLFGALSDKTTSKLGKRTVFILIGTISAVAFFIFLPIIQNVWLFTGVLLLTLLSMAIFRSPAVALMPDVTCKPLRSKGNAIINLVGTVGGLLVLCLGMVVKVGEDTMYNLTPYYIVVCGIVLIGLVVFMLTVKENAWAEQMRKDTEKYFPEKDEQVNNKTKKLSLPELKSLLLILSSVALWYMGYNAITSKYSLYADKVLNQSYDLTLLIAQAFAIISYLPVGFIATKIGRKKTILAGVIMLSLSFFFAIFISANSSPIIMYILFALAGVGWATINVNSFPMVVELAKESDVGKYTGWYYTASMSAQVLTPVLSGAIMDMVGNMLPLFPYAFICVSLAFITMILVKHGDSKPVKNSVLENFAVED
ncbi:MAG: SLC45 family MFS transporter [Clostridiales bacterium]|nr:SLC45 family MFS transporter [Clostridiales bacterium]